VAVLVIGAARGRAPRLFPWALVMAAGYGLYRAARAHRGAIAGGHGFASTPAALVTDGPYAVTRNPMYLGHLVFAAGLVGATRSPLAVALFIERLVRFRRRVAVDETRLERLFGDEYRAYRQRVPRWIRLA
jgi:protein-S-isoprenylcysteine O-methyltransferase Ste14